ncbi:monocarboxylate transporter 14 isoform X2 [Athalia rosae]|nr:monocarboxylate transporter 14 isoform X2 [Athalia rosae]XP_048511573.1 monocarboxylate transporter 14 isoform X2 [Athalia rosae]XP_048511574.1 monocarboxylate transporter 14 isoform X2 [Athalia rosae]
MATTAGTGSPEDRPGDAERRREESSAMLHGVRRGSRDVRTRGTEGDDVREEEEDEEQEVEVRMVVPPDGGWGWVIVAASFMSNLVVDGIIFSFGVFLVHVAEAFQVSKAKVALVGSLQTGFYLITGPFVSALANKYGFRPVAVLGSVVSCSSFVLSFFAESIPFLCISYGVLGGVGAGMIYVPAVISAGFYFERWRALATGIAVCGSGIGGFVMAPITDALINVYGWRGALLIQSGLLLNCAVFGALLRPLRPSRVKVRAAGERRGAVIEMEPLFGKSGSAGALYAVQPTGRRLLATNNNTEFSTAAEIVIGSSPDVAVNRRSSHSLHRESHGSSSQAKSANQSGERSSDQIYPTPEVVVDQDLKTVEEENNLLGGDLERLNGRVPTTTRRHTVSGRRDRANSDTSQKSYRSRHASQAKENIQRPFYRDDIFYGGSLHRLPHYKSQMSSVGYHMSVTRLPTEADVAEEESGSCYLCPEGVRRILSTMLDVSLLKSPSFLILAFSGSLTMMGFYTPFTYLPDRATIAGIEESTAMFLLSVIGITNTIGRVVCGVVSSVPGVDALLINNILISVSGIATILSGLSFAKEYQFFYAATFGLSISGFAALRSILIVDLMGLERLTNAFGLALLFQGVAASFGAPLAGVFMDLTGSYDVSFYISGSLILISAVICYPLGRINRWEKRRDGERADRTAEIQD